MQNIRIRGARTHNLRNFDLDLPRERLIVITGLSGRASPRWPSTRCMRRASAATSNRSRPTPGNSCR